MNRFKAYLTLARPHQYLKNGFIFFPLFFGHRLYDLEALGLACSAFLAFCAAASSAYVFNDICDREADRRHPVKRWRPLASGALDLGGAVGFLLLLLSLSVVLSLWLLPRSFIIILGAYLLLNLFYSWKLKHLAILDVVCIGLGFVLRIFAGGVAVNIWPSHWLVMMTFLLALFLALAKRRDDLLLAACGDKTRKCLDGYSLEFVSLSMGIMAAVIIVSYTLYTVSPEVMIKHQAPDLYLTTLWVIIGLLRYLQVTFVFQESGSPTHVLIKDLFLQIVLLLWIGSFYLLLYKLGY
jgi:4-hydroxybenzoate polyprenyltransferase